jgi:O-methyltransferase
MFGRRRQASPDSNLRDFSPADRALCDRVKPYTMTSPERVLALADSIRYVVANSILGAFVECGVWRGGSSMVAAETLSDLGDYRDLYLFDTYEGMVAPTDRDKMFDGRRADAVLATSDRISSWVWAVASLEDVKQNLASTGYPESMVSYVVGDVLETIPREAPEQIAVLRLDTDWYESTRHELEHLYPRLSEGGVLIIDDYGHWQGCRQAVDEFFGRRRPFFSRIDYTGRLVIKPQA